MADKVVVSPSRLTEKVMVVVVGVTVLEKLPDEVMATLFAAVPLTRVEVSVTFEVVSKLNPVGAKRTIVLNEAPEPEMVRFEVSVTTGPVSATEDRSLGTLAFAVVIVTFEAWAEPTQVRNAREANRRP